MLGFFFFEDIADSTAATGACFYGGEKEMAVRAISDQEKRHARLPFGAFQDDHLQLENQLWPKGMLGW